MMSYIRPADFTAFTTGKFETQKLFWGESSRIMLSRVPAGMSAPQLHAHPNCDQVYYVLRGGMHVQLGKETSIARPGALVFIPAGTSHRNWNESDEDEFHLEIFAPGPKSWEQLLTPVAGDDTIVPGGFVRSLDDIEVTPSARDGFSTRRLLTRADGSANLALRVGTVGPGKSGPDMHIHRFDQFYYVLEGRLTVDVALQHHEVEPGTLVVLPAGVPHRQYNAGAEPERHVVLIVPPPVEETGWDTPVTFESTR